MHIYSGYIHMYTYIHIYVVKIHIEMVNANFRIVL